MRKLTTLFILALALTFTFLTNARADAIQSSPDTAAYIVSGAPQTIPANTAQWYKFDYIGDKSLITVIMPNAADSLIAFNVLTPEQAQSWWEKNNKPIGRGTAYSIDCNTGEEAYYGDCKSNDLKWKGQFNFPGTFYVQVVNYNTGTANFNLTIDGTGVRLGPVPQPAPPNAPSVAVPSVPPSVPPPPILLPTTGGVWNASSQPRTNAPIRK